MGADGEGNATEAPPAGPAGGSAGSPLLERDRRLSLDSESTLEPLKYPKVVFFIIGNEFCERFSYYGMRTILSLFLVNALRLSQGNATIIYHVFVMLCYFFPVIGAIIADSWLGKFDTIAYLSVVYAIGNILVSVASATNIGIPSEPMTYLGLLLIAIGTGGIKPCVSAFGGDQFTLPQQARQLASFFSIFYFSINAGSLLSTYLTPELRTVKCFGQPCYPLAFGVPALLMLLALVIFVVGKPGYKIVKPSGNVLVDVAGCMWSGLANKLKSGESKDHWLDHADDRFGEKLRADIKAMLRVLLLFVPLPIFWALYDQQGSRWTFQANNMNGRIGSWVIKPDQMQVVNPLLILLFLPLFEGVVYPALNKARLLTRPLQKMATGGVIAAIAFIMSGLLELQLQTNYPVALSEGLGQVRVFNSLACNVTLADPTGSDLPGGEESVVAPFGVWTRTDLAVSGGRQLTLDVTGTCLDAGAKLVLDLVEETSVSYNLYTADPSSKSLLSLAAIDNLQKDSNPRVRFLYHFTDAVEHVVNVTNINTLKSTTTTLQGTGNLALADLDPDEYSIALDGKEAVSNQLLDVGGIYTVQLNNADLKVQTLVKPNVVHLMWLLPQYIVITVAEVMFSVTGLEFAFTQAPVSMKSVLTSAWLLTVAFGNLIVVLITEIRFFSSQAYEFFLFAALMLVVMVVFMWMAIKYTYVEDVRDSEDDEQNQMTILDNDKREKS
ncbi:peptide transporter family 1 isoform X2 [Thrips palmi]|uniref:Oligopeptide transporter 1 n=1 Tax=Thrips palmi TaxID=161013 RepID=A0A6P9ACQ0_THRPL|nr:peptide transporter family 1 isoform X2 [Thrips palmi]